MYTTHHLITAVSGPAYGDKITVPLLAAAAAATLGQLTHSPACHATNRIPNDLVQWSVLDLILLAPLTRSLIHALSLTLH